MSAREPVPVLALRPPTPAGHFPLAVAVICVNCEAVFAARPTCPGCASDLIYPIETFLTRRQGRAHEAATVAALHRLNVLRSA